ncbi:hypothetical protein A3D07_03585 [Candidatus Curtissbacteria bacterium RIFCSPHIGHO2_02_FULL_42_15]|uniref:Uncharacterized protein n=1 Tax=Candidatus Curtissbacteria bacterium RIFCSPHIGHO2_02_FULL_42_15 TaxID=1797716 RepID=A0A1F5GII3_9BACT|nr:MAG: hypothetical protein A3D07_03585 [Candidatus Curtissbacteria bacterium RIFCSPHIGHO2_02_FULL_42_15]
MATLSQTSEISKKTFVGGFIVVGLIFLLILTYRFGLTLKNMLFPAPPPASTVAFGKIPKLDISEGVKSSEKIDYKIETISGELPKLAHEIKVFKVDFPKPSFGDLERTKAHVAGADYRKEPESVTDRTAIFRNSTSPDYVLTINITSGNFIMGSNYLNNKELTDKRPTSVEQATEIARNFFNNLRVDLSSFNEKAQKNQLLKFEDGTLNEATSLSSVNFIKVLFPRLPIDEVKVINPRLDRAPIWALTSSTDVVEAQVAMQNIKKHKFSTYPLKEITKALEELGKGQGALNEEIEGAVFPIRDVEIVYLESENYQEYLQPVYLFKSDNNLTAYVPAVDDTWISESGTD